MLTGRSTDRASNQCDDDGSRGCREDEGHDGDLRRPDPVGALISRVGDLASVAGVTAEVVSVDQREPDTESGVCLDGLLESDG